MELYTFKCNKCDYDVESSGNLYHGFFGSVCPYICNDCNIVTDTMVGRYGVLYPYNLISGMPLNPEGDEVPKFFFILKMKIRMTIILVKSVTGKT